jgi:hypothetical protein
LRTPGSVAVLFAGKLNPVLGRIAIRKGPARGKNRRPTVWHGISNYGRTNLKDMFTLDEFRVMTFEKKCDVITFYGNYLLQRTLADCKVFLYYAEGFFIEVFYSPKHQKVLMINAFEKPIGLEPYLEKISLEALTVGPAI